MENKSNGTGKLYGNPTIQGQILSKLRSEAVRLKQTEFPFEVPVNAETVNRIYEWFEERNANQGLLATIGSWGDTLDAKKVLEYLE